MVFKQIKTLREDTRFGHVSLAHAFWGGQETRAQESMTDGLIFFCLLLQKTCPKIRGSKT